MKSIHLECGYTQIFFIHENKKNSLHNIDDLSAIEKTFVKLEKDRTSHRLSENYQLERMHLDKMFSFSIIYDYNKNLPVFITGVQAIGKYSARVFSRYFMFPEYRTHQDQHGMFHKVDNFEVLKNDLKFSIPHFQFIFWSRDKGNQFFKKIKKVRDDVFSDWEVYPNTIELLYKGNHQGLLYYNNSNYDPDYFINLELRYK